jgi:hypothetical protein
MHTPKTPNKAMNGILTHPHFCSIGLSSSYSTYQKFKNTPSLSPLPFASSLARGARFVQQGNYSDSGSQPFRGQYFFGRVPIVPYR